MGDGRRNLDVNCMVLHGHRVHVLDQQSWKDCIVFLSYLNCNMNIHEHIWFVSGACFLTENCKYSMFANSKAPKTEVQRVSKESFPSHSLTSTGTCCNKRRQTSTALRYARQARQVGRALWRHSHVLHLGPVQQVLPCCAGYPGHPEHHAWIFNRRERRKYEVITDIGTNLIRSNLAN
jgi:hypothetical protein